MIISSKTLQWADPRDVSESVVNIFCPQLESGSQPAASAAEAATTLDLISSLTRITPSHVRLQLKLAKN